MFNYTTTTTYYQYNNEHHYVSSGNSSDNGRGDALYRTSLAYIAYGDLKLKEDIMSCFRAFNMMNRRDNELVQGARAPFRYCEDDFSRDQYIMAMSALYIRGDYDEVKWIADRIPFRLSRRFKMTPTLYYWTKSLSNSNNYRFNKMMYNLLEYGSQLFIILADKIARRILHLRQSFELDELLEIEPDIEFWHFNTVDKKWELNTIPSMHVNNTHKLYNNHLRKRSKSKWYKLIYSAIQPAYSISLGSFMAHIQGGKALRKLLLCNVAKANTMHRLLLKDSKLDIVNHMKAFIPTTQITWNQNFDGTSMFYSLTSEQYSYNNIEYDILTTLSHDKT